MSIGLAHADADPRQLGDIGIRICTGPVARWHSPQSINCGFNGQVQRPPSLAAYNGAYRNHFLLRAPKYNRNKRPLISLIR